MLVFFQEYQTFFKKVKQEVSQDDKSGDKSVSRYSPLISISLCIQALLFLFSSLTHPNHTPSSSGYRAPREENSFMKSHLSIQHYRFIVTAGLQLQWHKHAHTLTQVYNTHTGIHMIHIKEVRSYSQYNHTQIRKAMQECTVTWCIHCTQTHLSNAGMQHTYTDTHSHTRMVDQYIPPAGQWSRFNS